MGTPFFTKNIWIGDSGALCHITNDNTGLFDTIDINESIQGISRNVLATKTGKLHIKILQVDYAEQLHTLRPLKFSPRASVNMFFLTCELTQGKKVSSDHQKNIAVKTT